MSASDVETTGRWWPVWPGQVCRVPGERSVVTSGDQLWGDIVTISPPPPPPDQNNIYLKVIQVLGLDMDGSLPILT